MCLRKNDKEQRKKLASVLALVTNITPPPFHSSLIFADCRLMRRFRVHVCSEILILMFIKAAILFLSDLLSGSHLFLLLSVVFFLVFIKK